MLQLIRENFNFLQENIWTGRAMFGLMLASMVFLSFDRDKAVRRIHRYSVIMLLGVVYNYFLFYGVIGKIYPEGEKVQLRLFWLVPFFLLMAYFLVRIISYTKNRWAMLAVLACSVVFVVWAGVPFHPDVVVERENWYKVSQEAIDSADLILMDMEEHPENLMERPTVFEAVSTDVNDDITAGNYYHYGIRQYTSDFTLSPVLLSPEVYEDENCSIINYYNNPSQYLISEKEMKTVQNTARKYGYHKLAENEDHVLFRYSREAIVYLVIRGQTKSDNSGELRGTSASSDVSLTTNGWWSILRVGKELQDVKFSYAYASAGGQTQITAGIILRENRNRDDIPKVMLTVNLNDISWGYCEGWKKQDVIETYGEVALDNGEIWDASYYSPIAAESKYYAAARFRAAMGDTVKCLEEDGLNILVVANPSISWWVKQVTDDPDMPDLKPGDYVKLRFKDGCWSIADND